jgi:glutathione synthase/RimK-type ligase-like ATP-grasp enzyme
MGASASGPATTGARADIALVTIALVTEDRFEDPTPGHWYVDNILEEDGLLQAALAARGLASRRISWSRPDAPWPDFAAAVLRTPWDYFERFAEFTAWLDRVAGQTLLLNPAPLVRWNTDKHYLRDLEARGVHTVPTVFVERGSTATLAALLHAHALPEAVIKPAVSGAARHTYRIDPATAPAHERLWAERLREESMLLQPLQRSVLEHGETTVVVIDGHSTHALRKRARPGDFRVQDDHGGTVHPHTPSPEELALAERAMAACEPRPIYGRVDMVRDNDGRLAVMELEVVEPELWLRREPSAAERLADAIARLV